MTPEEAQSKLETIRSEALVYDPRIDREPKDFSFFIGFMSGLEWGQYPSALRLCVGSYTEDLPCEGTWKWKLLTVPKEGEVDNYFWIGGTAYILTITLNEGKDHSPPPSLDLEMKLSEGYKSRLPIQHKTQEVFDSFDLLRTISVPKAPDEIEHMFRLFTTQILLMQDKYYAIRDDEEIDGQNDFLMRL
tara:strand:+ start:351 stop:917 length:567 start_codon:yes stop_codon:yes gene_type:complete